MRIRRQAGTGARASMARAIGAMTAALAVLVGAAGGVAGAEVSTAQDNPYERGPDPTEDSIEAIRGPFRVDEERVSVLAPGFGGGTIYYPTDTSEGTFGAVAVAPGFTADEGSMSWYGERIASQGFIVFTIDTNTRLDQPGQRGDQLLAALDYLVERSDSDVRERLDPNRLAVMGHSMGGGGSLEAAVDRPSLKASIPLTPWNLDKTWGEVQVPTFIIGAERDTIASVRTHAKPFYESLPDSLEKAYMELDGATHFAPNLPNTTIAKYTISWLKRFVDEDTRYSQFLCPNPSDRSIEEYRSTCPY
ncbi:alpha/beta hydrolase [Saccharomonospora sp.]|uniref:poly(ethylene terephthalate) hydrolase family protein n=1 Tax=Saccharomonospora sp. TaxID=33913 RepID=UPI002609EDAB|nr:alpha/beta hydrolase [Saccharomonospora sp.]